MWIGNRARVWCDCAWIALVVARSCGRVYRELAASVEGRIVPPCFLISGSVACRSPFYLEAFKVALARFLYDVRESTDQQIEVLSQLNGLDEAVRLADKLASGSFIPTLDAYQPFFVL